VGNFECALAIEKGYRVVEEARYDASARHPNANLAGWLLFQ